MNEPTLPIQEIAALLWRRRYLIATVFPVGLFTVIVLAWLQPPTYRANAKLMVTSARVTMTVSPDANERPHVETPDLSAEVNMLSSAPLVREVLEPYSDQLDKVPAPTLLRQVRELLSYPFSLPGRIYRRIHGLPPPSPMDEWVGDVTRRLSVAQVGLSNLIEVAYDDRRPEWAAELVNSLVSHHVERHIRMNRDASAQQFYESQRELLSDKLHEAEASLRSFYAREGIAATASGLPALRKRVAQLEADLDDAQAGLAENSAEAEFLGHAMTNLPATGAAPGTALSGPALIKNRVVELELQRSQLLAQYAPTSMKISDLDRQIAEARRLLEEEKTGGSATADPNRQALEGNLTKTQARTAALQARTAALRQQLEASRAQMAHMDSIGSEQESLEQEVRAAKESLATYLKKEEEARFSSALDESRIVNVSIVDRAPVPTVPLESKRTMTILMGAIASLAAGLGLAFVRDWLDASVKSGAEARRISGLPILAEIPA